MSKFLIIIFAFCSCAPLKYNDYKSEKDNNYYVSQIDSINNYYLIYAKSNDSIYKIVSEKNVLTNKCNKLKLNREYKLSLISYKKSAFKINGMTTIPLNTTCFGMDENTFICLEIEKGIYDLYFTENLVGLCFKD